VYIRTFKGHEDLDIVLELERICFPETGWSREEYEEIIDDPNLVFYMVFDSPEENILIADCFAFVNIGGETHFNSNSVHPDYRRMGLGGLMIKLREAAGRLAGDKKVKVEMSVNNKSSIAMHKKYGYKPTGVIIIEYYRNGDDAMQMEKEL